jgi:hypothetical protein
MLRSGYYCWSENATACEGLTFNNLRLNKPPQNYEQAADFSGDQEVHVPGRLEVALAEKIVRHVLDAFGEIAEDRQHEEDQNHHYRADLYLRRVRTVFKKLRNDEHGEAVEEGRAMSYVNIDGRAMLRACHRALIFQNADEHPAQQK